MCYAVIAKYWGIYLSTVFDLAGWNIPSTISVLGLDVSWGAFVAVGAGWAAQVISVGILVGLTTVIMVLLLGLSRVMFAMSRDGLLPRWLSVTSDKRRTPARI
jgi:APA family basic amino acid/polyamine antiporter